MTESELNAQSFELKGTEMPKLTIRRFSLPLRAAMGGAVALLLAFPALTAGQIRLLPAPREAHFTGETALPESVAVSIPGTDAEDAFAARDLEAAVKEAAHAEGGAAFRVVLLRAGSAEGKAELAKNKLAFDAPMTDEGYVLVVEPHEAIVVAATGSGIFYGVQTLKQLLPLAGTKPALPTGTVRDWPAMKYRGIQDDLSRGPFPTLEFQKHQIRIFASLKANMYSPYFEHTLLYPNQPLAAPPGSAMSPADVAELVRYARQYHITVLPEQEAFGHLHHVLKYDIYADVAETPHGHVLAPGQAGSLPLIKDWFTQIAQEFPSPFLHIGADETADLGLGRTREAVQAKGYGPVYVDFLKQIHDQLAPLNRRLLFWGDIGGADPKAVAGLPKDMVAVPWNYWDTKDFDKMIEPFSKAGIETWVAPGDANWNEVYPVASTAFGNIQGFVRDGQRLGSIGTINTVWNDDGEGLFNLDWYTVLFGPVTAWQPGESSISAYQDAFGPVFHGDASGKVNDAEKEIMAAYAALGKAKLDLNSDDLFWIDAWSPLGQATAAKLLPVASEMRRHAEQAIVLVAQVRRSNPGLKEQEALNALDLGARRLDLIGMKFELSQEIADGYAQAAAHQHDKTHAAEATNILEEISGGNGRCQDLRDAYSALKDEYTQVWLSENRPYWLGNVTVRYDLAIQEWQRRGNLFREATGNFQNGKDLPPMSTFGMAEATTAK
jgi:hypothetical protein